MAFPSARSADTVLLRRGALSVEIALRPLEITVWRGERRLIRSLGAWVAEGTIHDHFIQLTEGVVAHEDRIRAPGARKSHEAKGSPMARRSHAAGNEIVTGRDLVLH